MTLAKYSNSADSTFVRCPREFYYSYIQKINLKLTDSNLGFGCAVHSLLEYYYKGVQAMGSFTLSEEYLKFISDRAYEDNKSWIEQPETPPKTWENSILLFTKYVNRWQQFDERDSVEILSTEEKLKVKLPGMEDTPFTFILDLLIRKNGLIYGVDHKTTKGYLATAKTSYTNSPQFCGYTHCTDLLFSEKFGKMDGFIANVLAMRQLKSGLVFEFERFNYYFNDKQQLDWRDRILYNVQSINENIKKGRWIKRTENCLRFGGRPCDFSELCEQGRELGDEFIDEEKFKIERV